MSVLLFGHPLLGIGLLTVFTIRLVMLKDPQILVMTMIIGVVFGIVVAANAHNGDTPYERKDCHETVKAYPDMISANGGNCHFIAKSGLSGRKVIYFARFKSLAQKKLIMGSNRPLAMTLSGEMKAMMPATNVNQFDMRAYYHHQKIYEAFSGKEIIASRPYSQLTLTDRIHEIRSRFNHYCQALPKTLRTYALGLISGTRQSDFFDQMSGVKQLGLLHIFSISGMHVYYFLSILDRALTMLGFSGRLKGTVKLVCLGGYFIFSGGSPGLLRAVLMAGLAISSRMVGIPLSQLATLSLTLIMNLFMLPEALFLMGVQLSYGLALGLIATSRMTYFRQTVLLNLLSLPILLFHLYQWHLLSLAVNLLVLPLFGRLIFPLVIGGLLVGVVSHPLVLLIDACLHEFNHLLNVVGALPGMVMFGKPALVVVWALLFLTFIMIVHHGGRRMRLVPWVVLVTYGLTFIWIHFPLNGEVTMFDIGQGDSFLIRTPLNRSVTLIDTGGKVVFDQQPWQRGIKTYQASRLSINYLKSIGISKIDTICVSHQDADHCGDLPAFLTEMQVGRLVIPLGMDKNPSFMKRIEMRAKTTSVISVSDRNVVSGLPLTIYHPYEPGKGENHDSEVLGGRFGGLSWLFTGDLDRQGEMDTLGRHPGLKTDVIKVGHHGSRTASDPQFISQIHPKIALISAGRNNRYNHPNQETLVTLKKAHVAVWNTQDSGMVRYMYRQNSGHFEPVLDRNEGKMQ